MKPQSVECILISYAEEEKGYNILNIITKNIVIERSVHFEEPIQDLKLVEEEIAKLLPLFDEESGDESESLCSDILGVMYDINEH